MARTEVFTCDLCKQSKGKNDLAKLNVKAEGIRMKGIGYSGLAIDICTDCLKKKGFVVDSMTDEEAENNNVGTKNAKTLEEKIFDILQDLGVMFEE